MRSAQVNQFGVTVGQSIGRRLVVGSTLKLLRGGAVAALAPGSSPLTEANDLAVPVHTRADLDVGGMLNLGRVRFGLTARNLTQPSFGDTGTEQLTLTRQARAGVAVFTVPHGFMEGLIVAADADLLTTPTPLGDVRHAAGGVEWWLVKGRLGGRGGASVNTVGAPRPSYSVGVSGAPTRAFHVNASWTTGQDATVAGWSAGVSVVY